MKYPGRPQKEGLYDPRFEHDACGIGFLCQIKGKASNFIIEKGICLLENLDHRGATGAEKNSGDGAGILIQIHHAFFLQLASEIGIALPHGGEYGIGMLFLPPDKSARQAIKKEFEKYVRECGQSVLGWRRGACRSCSFGKNSSINAADH